MIRDNKIIVAYDEVEPFHPHLTARRAYDRKLLDKTSARWLCHPGVAPADECLVPLDDRGTGYLWVRRYSPELFEDLVQFICYAGWVKRDPRPERAGFFRTLRHHRRLGGLGGGWCFRFFPFMDSVPWANMANMLEAFYRADDQGDTVPFGSIEWYGKTGFVAAHAVFPA